VSITTTSMLSAPVQTSFNYKLLSVPVPYMVHSIPCELKSMPRNGGSVFRQSRFSPLATAPVPLGNSGITPPPQVLSALNIDATINFYGTYVLLNDQVTLQNQCPVLNEAAIRLGKRYAEDKFSLIDLEALRGDKGQALLAA
jgi:N4-gp56 family major capsid protein